MALAAALRRGRGRRPVARQDPQARQNSDHSGDHGTSGGADLHHAAASGHPLDRPCDGQSDRHFAALSATHLAGLSIAAASSPHLQTFARSQFCRQAGRHCRALCRSPGPCRRALARRKSQIQALDRTQPGLPIKPGRCQTMTHDYKRHGTTTLFAALSVLDGGVIGRCMQRHRHSEFIRFLNAVERDVPAGKLIHAVLDNYATHKHPKVLAWLARHPRWTFHFTPTSASWLNAVENFFSKMTRQRIRRGIFRAIADLQAAINRYLKQHNHDPKPFVWTKPAHVILAKLDRLPVLSV